MRARNESLCRFLQRFQHASNGQLGVGPRRMRFRARRSSPIRFKIAFAAALSGTRDAADYL
jgi:hypothetical protein